MQTTPFVAVTRTINAPIELTFDQTMEADLTRIFPPQGAAPGIVATLGPNVPVFLDGGVRRGVHVFKALALRASAVAVGRPTLYSLALGGAPGVKSMFEALKTALRLTMKLAGCAKSADISRKWVT